MNLWLIIKGYILQALAQRSRYTKICQNLHSTNVYGCVIVDLTECSYHHLGRFVLFLYIGIANVTGFKLSMMLSYIVRSNAHKDYEDVAVCVALLALTFGVAPEYLNTIARWIDWFLYTTKLNLVSAILNLAMTKLAWYQSIHGFVVQERINTFVKLWFRCP